LHTFLLLQAPAELGFLEAILLVATATDDDTINGDAVYEKVGICARHTSVAWTVVTTNPIL
jgi:hypothetical protein